MDIKLFSEILDPDTAEEGMPIAVYAQGEEMFGVPQYSIGKFVAKSETLNCVIVEVNGRIKFTLYLLCMQFPPLLREMYDALR